MKYQDLETRSHFGKIQNLLSRLDPPKTSSHMRIVQYTSRSNFKSEKTLRQLQFRQQKPSNPLTVDVLHHQNHNIFVFVPADSQQQIKQQREKLRGHRYSKPILSKASSSKLSRLTAASKNSFRVKKWSVKEQQQMNKENREMIESRQDLFQPILLESKLIKGEEPATEQKQLRKYKKLKCNFKVTKQQKPELTKFLIDHKCLTEFETKCKLNEEKIIGSQTEYQYLLLKDVIKQRQIFLKSETEKEKLDCPQQHISFLLNVLYSHQPNLIKRLFGKCHDENVKLVLNYEGCFRTLPIKYIQPPNSKNQFLKSRHGSVWPEILSQALSILNKGKINNFLKTKQLYEMITGLSMEQVKINETSSQRLLEIISSLSQQSSQIILGQVHNGQFATITPNKNSSFTVKKYIFQSVCSQFSPKAEQLVHHLINHYKVIRIADFSPDYYFFYKQIEYTLGVDSCIKLEIQEEPVELILQISKQTIAFDGKIKLSVEQKREEGVEEIYGESIRSLVPLKKKMKLMPGGYCIRFSDDKESIKEYKFPIALGVISKKNIGGWFKKL